MHTILLEEGFAHDVIDAVEAVSGDNPSVTRQAVEVLTEWVQRDEWSEILPAFSRCVRITRDLPGQFDINPNLLVEAEESALYQAIANAEKALEQKHGFDNALTHVEKLVQPINAFFDKVLVMVDDQPLRETRLGMLQRIAALVKPFADLSKLEGF